MPQRKSQYVYHGKDRKMKNRLLLLFLLCSFVFLAGIVPLAQARYTVGDTVHNFKLYDLNRRPCSLYGYKGKIVVLNFFATW